jgi:hypothetical protein
MYLFLLDINSIQNYIFETNTLVEIIGASALISLVQKKYVYECLKELRGNIDKYDKTYKKLELNDKKIQEDTLDYEVILSDGGNTFVLFSEEDTVEKFKYDILSYYNKYDIQVTSGIFKVNATETGTKYFELIRELKRKRASGNMGRVSVSAYPMKYCSSCAKRYVEFEDCSKKNKMGENNEEKDKRKKEGDLLCRICAEKRKHSKLEDIEKYIKDKYIPKTVRFTKSMNEISDDQTGDISLISFDGNKVGKYIKEKIFKGKNLFECLRIYRKFSEDFNKFIIEIIADTVHSVFNESELIQFRPLILAGDDITLVLNSRYAVNFIKIFNEKLEKKDFFSGKNIKFSTGMVISKANFPLHQLFSLSHELLGEAKKKNLEENKNESVIDFHFVNSSLFGPLSYMRKEEYYFEEIISSSLTEKYNCYNRPYFLEEFKKVCGKAKKIKELPNSKVKSLRDIMRLGATDKGKIEVIRFKIHLKDKQKEIFDKIVKKDTLWRRQNSTGIYETDIMDIIELSELLRRD